MEFILGCNYWASNAGTEMWNQWSEEAVREDFEILSNHGVKYLRVFPNWRDFQPVIPLYGCRGRHKGYLLEGDKNVPNPYFLDEEMLDKFDRFCDLAEEYNLKFIVGLLTGWMSGRLFVPPVLYEKNLYSDATALMLEQRFIKGFVSRFKGRQCIYAWDLGNECDCLSETESRERADTWAMTVSNAIRANDPDRPIISGMHGLDIGKMWNMFDQAESVDMFTTHPYPYWVAHCSEAKVTSVQTLMHATCQTKYYAELGKKPCLVEEIGTMGPMICGDREAGDFLKVNLFSNWANGATGVMWWCANEQIHLMFAPYTNSPCETELGMIDKHRRPRPVLQEMKQFSEWLKTLDFRLPKAEVDAICLMSENVNGDNWGLAYSSYCLARQAGLNVSFTYANQGIPEAENYILPCVSSAFMSLPSYLELRKKVYEGANVYISNANGIIPEFSAFTGLEVRNTETKADSGKFMVGNKVLEYKRTRNYYLTAVGAEVLAADSSGNPLFTRYRYGKGMVYYLNFPLENNLIGVSDGYEGNQHEIYRAVFAELLENHVVSCDNQYVGITHHIDGDQVYAVLINYSDKRVKTDLKIRSGYRVSEVIRGESSEIEPFETVILRLEQHA